MSDLVVALGLVLVIEGILYAALPDTMKRLMAQVMEMPVGQLRTAGLVAAAVGLSLVWVVRS
ncbi:MAG: DUF2065 domain-containing protein [Alphaproteobacteria bacterium]|nr:DUF2065 domain-containing protein [Alphaproteobacteria bacterium]